MHGGACGGHAEGRGGAQNDDGGTRALTEVALADDTVYAPSEIGMPPPIKVRCLLGNDAKPFAFFEQETK